MIRWGAAPKTGAIAAAIAITISAVSLLGIILKHDRDEGLVKPFYQLWGVKGFFIYGG